MAGTKYMEYSGKQEIEGTYCTLSDSGFFLDIQMTESRVKCFKKDFREKFVLKVFDQIFTKHWVDNRTRSFLITRTYKHKAKKFVYEFSYIWERMDPENWYLDVQTRFLDP